MADRTLEQDIRVLKDLWKEKLFACNKLKTIIEKKEERESMKQENQMTVKEREERKIKRRKRQKEKGRILRESETEASNEK